MNSKIHNYYFKGKGKYAEETTESNIISKNISDLTNFDNLPLLDDASAVAFSSARFYYSLNILNIRYIFFII